MTRGRTIVRDRGWGALVVRLKSLAFGYTTVGVHGNQVTEDGTSLSLVASANEYGTIDGRVPERSFMRSAMDEGRAELGELQRRLFLLVLAGKMDPKRALGIIGAKAKALVQAKIASNIPPPNAPSTIARKGSTRTLIDTGQLRQGIEYVVHPTGKRLR
jgi:hypothetical protein